jgi:predicted metal-dependent hydrolase
MLNFFGKQKGVEKSTFLVQVDGIDVPVELFVENRNGWRVRLTTKKGIVRISDRYDERTKNEILLKCVDWIKKKVKEKPTLVNLMPKDYDNEHLVVMGQRTNVLIERKEGNRHFAKFISNDSIHLVLAENDTNHIEVSKKLLSKIIANKYLPIFTRRVYELNAIFFKKQFHNIKLKDINSKWGSCSSNGNLNFSTKLLLAPLDVIDYVIIHELSHLIEMNHSDRFWSLVKNAMPDYKEKEIWLKKNGHLCAF